MLGSGCSQNTQYGRQSIDSELFLLSVSPVIELDKDKAKFLPFNPAYNNRIALQMRCSPDKRNYMWISDEKEFLQFFIVAKPRLDLGIFNSQNVEFFNVGTPNGSCKRFTSSSSFTSALTSSEA